MLAFVLLFSAFSDDDSDGAPIPTIATAPPLSQTPRASRLPTFTEDVIDLEGLPTPNGTSYVVFFYSERCDQCFEVGRGWSSIARVGAGLTTWAALNCDKYPRDCQYHAVVLEEPSIYVFEGNGTWKEFSRVRDIRHLLDEMCSRVEEQYIFVDRYNYTINPDENAAFLFMDGKLLPKLWTAVQNVLNRTDIVFYASVDKGLYEDVGVSKFPGVYAVKNGEFILFQNDLMPRDVANFLAETFPLDQAPGQTEAAPDDGL